MSKYLETTNDTELVVAVKAEWQVILQRLDDQIAVHQARVIKLQADKAALEIRIAL